MMRLKKMLVVREKLNMVKMEELYNGAVGFTVD